MAAILAIECTSFQYSIAIGVEGKTLCEKHFQESNPVNELTIQLEDLFNESKLFLEDLSGICLVAGPGSYSSLRAGIAIVKGIVSGKPIPVISIDKDLALLSLASKHFATIITVIPSRKGFCLLSAFDSDRNPLYRDKEHSYASVLEHLADKENCLILGEGLDKLNTGPENPNIRKLEKKLLASDLIPYAFEQYSEGRFVSILELVPKYHFEPMTTQSKIFFNKMEL